MRVKNMTSARGNKVANQFIIEDCFISTDGRLAFKIGNEIGTMFQSYNSNIAFKSDDTCQIYLDEKMWDFSATTGKYRNLFLGEKKAETEKKIASGEYKLVNLN